MTTNYIANTGEAGARPEKEKGAIPFETTPTSKTSSADSTASALAWIVAAAIVALLGEVAR